LQGGFLVKSQDLERENDLSLRNESERMHSMGSAGMLFI